MPLSVQQKLFWRIIHRGSAAKSSQKFKQLILYLFQIVSIYLNIYNEKLFHQEE
jgi:hypothetical protein